MTVKLKTILYVRPVNIFPYFWHCSLWPEDAIWHHYTGSNLGQVMIFCLFLFFSIFIFLVQVMVCFLPGTNADFLTVTLRKQSMEFESNFKYYPLGKCIRNCHLCNGSQWLQCIHPYDPFFCTGIFIPPASTKYNGFTLSVRLWTESCPLCIFNITRQIHFIFAHLIKQLQKVCGV